VNTPALGRLLALEADVLEIAGIPQGIEVTLEGGRVINVARAGKNAGANGFGWNPTIAMNYNFYNYVLLAQTCRAQPQKAEQQAQEYLPRFTNLYN
jgi:hypothetical protein